MTIVNPRSITEVERPWLENLTTSDLAYLMKMVRDRGYSASQARGLAGWLVEKAQGVPDSEIGAGSATKAQYRKILSELAESIGAPPPGAGRSRRRDESGHARIIHLAAVTGGAVSVLAHNPIVAGLSGGLLVITYPVGNGDLAGELLAA